MSIVKNTIWVVDQDGEQQVMCSINKGRNERTEARGWGMSASV